ncbi:MAG: aspartate dehydrogenase [Candidatus Bathyarchaeia archaeon]
MKTVGIIGCGVIGTVIAKAVDEGIVKCDMLILYDYDHEKAENLRKSLRVEVEVVGSLEEMLRAKPAVIVEAASQQAVKEYLQRVLAENVELIVMSVGALLEIDVRSCKIHVPSGAIGGLDAVSSAALAGIDEVTLTTRKNPQTLDLNDQREKTAYDGYAEEAVRLFPREMNVAATLALAVRPRKVMVKVISDPKANRNIHEIKVAWKHGDMLLRFENDPYPDNPKTSALAAWSAIKLLNEVLEKTP